MIATKEMKEAMTRAIDAAGGYAELAEKLRRNFGVAISLSKMREWEFVPEGYVPWVEVATGVSRHELRPDKWGPTPEENPLNQYRYPGLAALLPRIADAQREFTRAWNATWISENELEAMEAAVRRFNHVLSDAFDAIVSEDPRNDRKRLRTLYAPRDGLDLYFHKGESTAHFLRCLAVTGSYNEDVHAKYGAVLPTENEEPDAPRPGM